MHPAAGGESSIQAAVGVHSGDSAASCAVYCGEKAPYRWLAAAVEGDRIDIAIHPASGVESSIQAAVGVHSGNIVASCAVDCGEKAACVNPIVDGGGTISRRSGDALH